MTKSVRPSRERDAPRSRKAITCAAERLFAEHGYDGATLQQIGEAAGLSRGAPGYLFGSKELLYEAVLDRLFADRDIAVRCAFGALDEWVEGDSSGSLEKALVEAASGYLQFLVERPEFVRVIQWEALNDGRRLRASPSRSRAAEKAFAALAQAIESKGLGRFDYRQAVVVYTSLCFLPVAFQATFLDNVGFDLSNPEDMQGHVQLVVAAITNLVEPQNVVGGLRAD